MSKNSNGHGYICTPLRSTVVLLLVVLDTVESFLRGSSTTRVLEYGRLRVLQYLVQFVPRLWTQFSRCLCKTLIILSDRRTGELTVRCFGWQPLMSWHFGPSPHNPWYNAPEAAARTHTHTHTHTRDDAIGVANPTHRLRSSHGKPKCRPPSAATLSSSLQVKWKR